MIEGESDYPMPENIYADKIRWRGFDDGSERYMVKRLRRKDLFEHPPLLGFGQCRWRLPAPHPQRHPGNVSLSSSRQREKNLPDTADLSATPPEVQAPFVLPDHTRYYIRNANRIPRLGST